jgi:uncharacterized OB-fold protein
MEEAAITAVIPQALSLDAPAPALLGTRCADCGTLYYPQVVSCRNPDCEGKDVVPARIMARGQLYSFTVQRYRPPPLFAIESWQPYVLGLVDVENGLRVMGIVEAPLEEVRIGMPLRLSTLTLNAEGAQTVMTHSFVPDDGADT